MGDGNKTKFELIHEPARLKKKLAGLESSEARHTEVGKALQKSEQTLKAILAAYPVGICLVKDRVIQWGNKAYYRIFDYRVDSLEGEKTRMFYQEESEYRRVGRLLFKNNGGSQVSQTETRLLTKRGRLIDCYLQASPLDPSNPEKGYILSIMDITERKRSEQVLRKSEEKYRGLVERLDQAIYHVSLPSGKYEYISPAAQTVFGYSPEEFLDNPLLLRKIVHPDFKEYFTEKWNGLALGIVPDVWEYKIIDSRGKEKWITQANKGIFDGRGRIIAVEAICRDMTTQKNAEEKLRESESRYRHLFNRMSSGVAVYEAGPDGETFVIKDFNKAGERIDKTSREKIIGKDLIEAFPGIKAFGLYEVLQRVWRTGIPEQRNAHFYKDRMREGWRENYVYKLPTGEVVSVFDDVSERKRAEEELRISEKRFRDIAENASEWIWEVDASGRYTYASPVVEKILGYQPREILGRYFYDFFHPETRQKSMEEAFKVFAEKECFLEFINQAVHKTGRTVWLMTSGLPILDDRGNLLGYRGADTDITKYKRADDQIREREKRFKFMSFHDGLTGLYNRTYFEEQIARLERNLSRFSPLSIVSVDIDGLKIVNDSFGHKAGDEILIATARIICRPFRNVDIIARVGGDEFCIILPKVDARTVAGKKDNIVARVRDYNARNPVIPLSISIGVATTRGVEGESIYEVYQKADDSMYEYKITQAVSPRSKVIDILLAALSERDFIAEGHAERLLTMAEKMARRMKLSDAERRNLFLLAKVHDMGKVGIPDEILFKPRKLTAKEYDKMKEHSRIGYKIASRSKELSHIANLILCHHEFWNGTGYPSGLRGEEIPLECRILSIMDAYDAMTTARPGNTKRTREEAIEELRRCAGTQFEPRLVEEFIRVLMGEAPAVQERAARTEVS